MNDNEKREFVEIMKTTADLYDKEIKVERLAVYWDALKNRNIEEVKIAINRHVQDENRGRFFPLPADISAQLPKNKLWPDADEAWAMCPKDEYSSAAMCEEMSKAYGIASDLIGSGDMIAARMAFKSAYSRIVEESKMQGKKPHWFASLGFDKEGRFEAQEKTVEMNNLCLPYNERKKLPKKEEECISLESLTKLISEN